MTSSTLACGGAAPGHGRLRRHAALAGGLLLLLLGVLAWRLVAEPFAIPSQSMEPTLRPGDQVLVEKLSLRFGGPGAGDLVVFRAPDTGAVTLKRVVAVGGDRVGIADGVLVVNGRRVREGFVDRRSMDSVYFGPVVVPPGHVFVLGDNRAESRDSRDFGPVSERALIGRVLARLWPPRR